MAWKSDQFHRHLAAGALKPVYLIAGDEHLLVLEAADALRAAARAQDFSERDVLESDESGFEWHDLARSAAGLSLFATRRIIDLRVPTGRPGKEGSEAIQAYCAAPAPDTVLLITATTWSKAHETAWVGTVEQVGAFLPCWPLKREEMPAWLMQRAAARGLSLAHDAVELLIERTEGNLLAAAQELDKLTLLLPPASGADGADGAARRVSADALAGQIADSARFDVFKLMDAALGGDAARALHIVAALRAEGEQVPGLVGWVTTQLQLMVRLAAAVEGGQPPDRALESERVWQNRKGLYRAALGRGRLAFWEARLAHAALVERIGKGRAAGDAWRELERLIGGIADGRLARVVAPAA